MFCSKCGKTLPLDVERCPACDHAVGESRFEGSPYTSAQAHILPGDDVRQTITQSYTRINYTSMDQIGDQGDVDARTTYRPAYGGDSMPEDIHRDMRAAVNPDSVEDGEEDEQPAERPAEDVVREDAPEQPGRADGMDDEFKTVELDLSKYRAQKIESAGQTGISSDVSELIQELEADSPRRSRRRAVYEDYEEPAPAGPAEASDEDVEEAEGEQAEVYDDMDDEEYEELRHSGFSLKQLVKVLVAMVVCAALVVGVLMWVRYIRSNQSAAPIENVREQLYVDGIALIKEHAAEESVNEAMQAYAQGGLTQLSTAIQTSAAELDALMPEDATEEEKIFLNALDKIQNNIANCITSDALAVASNDAAAVAESDTRWQVVENSITMLEAAESAAALTAIINGEEIDVAAPEATATPEPAVNYNTLSKGDKSDDVFNMQNRLFELGWLLDDRDGAFGSKTQTAVKMFQQAVGLEITGIADNATLTAMYADDAPRTSYAQPTATPAPTATPEPAAPAEGEAEPAQ